jgi:hypothetical protein
VLRSSKALTILGFTTLVAGTLVVAPHPAAAGPLRQPETLTVLHTRVVKVTTSRHVQLDLSMLVQRAARHPGASNARSRSTLAITLSKGSESHTWTFRLAGGSFTDNGLIGSGRVATGKQMAPYGVVALRFSPLSPKTVVVCDRHNAKINHRVGITGRVRLRTHSAWGTYSGRLSLRHGLLQAGHGQDVEEGCARIPCRGGVSWTVSQGLTSIDGLTTRSGGRLMASRLTRLSLPRHASRLDLVTIATPRPRLSGGALPSLSVHPTARGVTGGAKLRATASSPYRQDCASGQLRGHQWAATFSQGSPPLTFHEHVFGPLTVSSRPDQQLLLVHVTR